MPELEQVTQKKRKATKATYPSSEQLIQSRIVREMCGSISESTLWRWQKDIGFPQPHFKTPRRNFYLLEDVRKWIANQAEQTAA